MDLKYFLILTLIVLASSIYLLETKLPFATPPLSNHHTINDQITPQLTLGSTHYLFDVFDHGPEQLKSLLERAEELSKNTQTTEEQLRIAMVIHGPDIKFFQKENYDQNKELVNLAAHLDAFDIIDFKVCVATASSQGVSADSFPAFMELVPLAPTEISRLRNKGYVDL